MYRLSCFMVLSTISSAHLLCSADLWGDELRVSTDLHCKEDVHWTDGAEYHGEGPSYNYIFALGAPDGQHYSDGKTAPYTQVSSCILRDNVFLNIDSGQCMLYPFSSDSTSYSAESR